MGAEKRQPDADLNGAEPGDAESALTAEERAEAQLKGKLSAYSLHASRYSFYRLLYLLERLFPDTPRLGYTGPASEERIRVRADPALIFSASDVSGMDYVRYEDGEQRSQVTASFLGLYGSVSPMPPHYVEEIALSVHQGGPQPVREMLDVFHHRLFSLVYRCWSKYRHWVGYRLEGRDDFTKRVFCCVGLDRYTGYKPALDPFYFLQFAPLLAAKSRSARGLQVVLEELFGKMGVNIEQFVGHWTLIEKPLRNALGVANHQLGFDLTIGRYVYDGSGRYTIVLGPLQYDDYLSFLPGGYRRPFLQCVVDTFTPGIHDVMLELHVDLEAAPRFQLGSPRASTLQRTCWLGGTGEDQFCITVPLEDREVEASEEDEEEMRYEPPPLNL